MEELKINRENDGMDRGRNERRQPGERSEMNKLENRTRVEK
jgi:hypothetical protein